MPMLGGCHRDGGGKAATNLGLTNMEVLIAVVDDAVLWAASSDETQTLEQMIIYMGIYSSV